jgi:hypothetical protein
MDSFQFVLPEYINLKRLLEFFLLPYYGELMSVRVCTAARPKLPTAS